MMTGKHCPNFWKRRIPGSIRYSRVAYEMNNFPEFVQDVKQCARTSNIQLVHLMAVPETGIGLDLDFIRDDFEDTVNSMGYDNYA